MAYPDFGLVPGDRFGDDKAAAVVTNQNWRAFTDSIGVCHFAVTPPQGMVDIINAATGWNIDLDETLRIGERIFQLQRALSCRLGVKAKDDCLPGIIMRPLANGGTEGHVPNMKKMLSEYYALRGWDFDSGKPTNERLASLDMSDIAKNLWE